MSARAAPSGRRTAGKRGPPPNSERGPSAEPRSRAPELFDRMLGLVLAAVSLGVVVTCSATAQQTRITAPKPLPSRAESAPAAGFGAAPGEPEPASADPAPSAPGVSEAWAPRFFASLRELRLGQRQDHVRIVWLGDSHTAADLWTHQVRLALQTRFGVGGPGFFHLGLKQMRHSQVKVDVLGSWQRLPTQPARTEPLFDGVFGLGGMRAVAKDRALLKAKLHKNALVGTALWRIYYRAPATASFQLKLGAEVETVRGQPADAPARIQKKSWQANSDAELTFMQIAGMPELFGAVVEGSTPGVVVDTLGIDGARARTPLAWQAEAWQGELAERAPDLVVLAYGTNEVFEARQAQKYLEDYRELMGRIRKARPEVECVMFGPTDVAEGPERRSRPRVLEVSSAQRSAAQELGCKYWGAHELMGGEGSYGEWQTTTPQLAGNDGVHLTARGYQELGTLTADLLLREYDRQERTTDNERESTDLSH